MPRSPKLRSSKFRLVPLGENATATGTTKTKTSGNEARVKALLAADAAWLKAYQSKDAAAAAAFYAKNGAMLVPNRPLLTGARALEKFIAQSFQLEDYDIVWHAKQARVARSGELGYTSGSYEMRFRPARGKLFFDKGKYLMVWERQADDTWKVLLDMSNSDMPSGACRI